MDVVAIFRVLMNHKLAVVGVALATMAAVGYVLFAVPAVYEQSSSVVVLPARGQPSESDIAKSPELAELDPYNPFSGDPSLIVSVVSQRLSNDQVRDDFKAEGLNPDYTVEPALRYGAARPEMIITASGSSPEQTVATRTALTEAVQQEMVAVQAEQDVASYYMLTTVPVAPTSAPKEKTSTMVRTVVAVGGLGGITLFALISLLEGVRQVRGGGDARGRRSRSRSRHRRARASRSTEARMTAGQSDEEERAEFTTEEPEAGDTPANGSAESVDLMGPEPPGEATRLSEPASSSV